MITSSSIEDRNNEITTLNPFCISIFSRGIFVLRGPIPSDLALPQKEWQRSEIDAERRGYVTAVELARRLFEHQVLQ
jgi:hypothetical protein